MPHIVSQPNPDKAKILRAIKRGKLTPAQAAKKYGIPLSGVLGWMRLAKIPIPAELNRPHRRPRSKPTLARGRLD